MGLVKTEGVVLGDTRFGESSEIVTLYTRDWGKLKLVAKGALRPKSRLVGNLEPITHVQVVFYFKEGKDLHTLSQSDLIDPLWGLHGDLERFGYGGAVCELTGRLVMEGQPNRPLFALLLDTLKGMETVDGGYLRVYLWFFELRALGLLGYRPQFTHCVSCGSLVAGRMIPFSLPRGGILCSSCRFKLEVTHTISPQTLDLLRRLQVIRPENVPRITQPAGLGGEVEGLLEDFLQFHARNPGELKSLGFLDKLRRAPVI